MKNILTFLLIGLGLIILSCSENNQNNNPVQTKFSTEFDHPVLTDGENIFIIRTSIDGAVGGEINVDTSMINLSGDLVRIQLGLKFDSLTFKDVRSIKIIPNINDATIQFSPHIVFDKPVKLSLEYTGINLADLGFSGNDIIKFVFINDDGSLEPLDYSFCQINWPQQSLRVSNAKLSHFSRYGFIK
jgi:hypothetical protein